MLTSKMEQALNEQLNKELFSSYLYLAMSSYCDALGLQGASNWMNVQSEEEHFHAMKIYKYIQERGGRVMLEQIDKPQSEWKSLLDVFEATLEHEQFITKSINELMSLAIEEKDHASCSFLNWFIDEQVEEEATVGDLLNKIKLIGETGNAAFVLDQELAKRIFVPPAQ